MVDKRPTPEVVHEKLIDALSDYLVLTIGSDDIRATDYVVSVAGIDLSRADGQVYYATAYTGAPHSRLGLVEILSNDVAETIFPEG